MSCESRWRCLDKGGRGRVLFVLTVAVGIWLGCGVPASAAEHSLSDIWQRFGERQAAATNVRVEWQKSGVSRVPEQMIPPYPNNASGSRELEKPPQRNILIVSGDRGRLETTIFSLTQGPQGTPVSRMETFDGRRAQSLTESSYGVTKEMTEFDGWKQMALWGLNLNIRPLKPWLFGPSPDAWTIDERTMIVDGRSCVILSRNEAFPSHESWRTIVALDPQRAFIPLRWDREVDGKLRSRCTMTYDEEINPPWIPTVWTAALFLNDTVPERIRSELESVTLSPKIRDDMFTINYPSRTEVTQIDDGQEAKQVVDGAGNLVPKRLVVAETSTVAHVAQWPLYAGAVGCAALGVALLLWWRTRTTG